MGNETCEDCGCNIYKFGCVNCNEDDYITMQDEGDTSYAYYSDGPEEKR